MTTEQLSKMEHHCVITNNGISGHLLKISSTWCVIDGNGFCHKLNKSSKVIIKNKVYCQVMAREKE